MTSGYFIHIKNMEITANRGHRQRMTGNRQETRSNESRKFTRVHLTIYTFVQQEEI